MTLQIADLTTLEKDAAALFGGKAHGLNRLIRADAHVPRGFAVAAATLPSDQWHEKDRAAFQERVAALLSHGNSLSVRSSAKGEDSAERSFAGMFETVLNVKTAEDAFAAASHCIASGASDRVLQYAGTDAPIPVGLVVQKMVSARAAGVCFTCDPSGKDRAVVIEAVAGLGDQLVSGHAQPERW